MRHRRGITNAQASYLAWLQRRAGEPYTGAGMSRAQASQEIERLLEAGSPAHDLKNGPPDLTCDRSGARRSGNSVVGAD